MCAFSEKIKIYSISRCFAIHSLRVCVHEMLIKLAEIQLMGGAEGIDSNAAPNLIIQYGANILDRHRASRTIKSSINFPIATDLNDKSFRMFFFFVRRNTRMRTIYSFCKLRIFIRNEKRVPNIFGSQQLNV